MIKNLKDISSELSIFLTFFFLIVLGTALLELPLVEHSGGLDFLDALFTATSAVCVTGLVTVPTSGFNLTGQLILLTLMQLGAIGIMTLTSSLILFFRGDLNLEMRLEASRMTGSYALAEVEGILATVLKYTLTAEVTGMALLTMGFHLDGFSMQESLYQGLFHAVSAFCNAGFSPFDQSLIGANPLIKYTVMALIITGGLGYYVIFDIVEYVRHRDALTLHTKSVLLGTPLLIVCGALLILIFERSGISFVDALFQSVTSRTAGFNTVDLTGLETISHLVLIIFMVIGAAPGSTGGGVKITTFFVALVTVVNVIRGNNRIILFGRKVPIENILRAFSLLILYCSFLAAGCALLVYFEKTPFVETLFETASALGTVGLSLGLTPVFGPIGKLILIAAMFIGRIGPAVLVIVLLRGSKTSHVDYPEEKIILG